jgi:DNA-binding transcriptional MerR regulator
MQRRLQAYLGRGSSAEPSPRGRLHTDLVLTIGEFSRLTHLSVRTLRRYHDAGLLVPATVDQTTAYRYYSVDQIASAQVIHRLRSLDVPLADVHEILLSPDAGTRAGLVAEHVRRLESELQRKHAAVVALRRLLSPEPAPFDVSLRNVPPMTAAAVSADVHLEHVLSWYAGAAAELQAAVVEPSGAPGGMYDDALFQTGHGHVVVYVPTAEPPRTGRVHPLTLPAAELVVTTHEGPHDDIDVTYGELGRWVVENALSVTGPVRETYLVGPRDTAEPTAWRTEIAWPVFGLSAPAVRGA